MAEPIVVYPNPPQCVMCFSMAIFKYHDIYYCAPHLVKIMHERIKALEARRPIVCPKCHGGNHVECCGEPPCPDCGKDGCAPGVVWEEKS